MARFIHVIMNCQHKPVRSIYAGTLSVKLLISIGNEAIKCLFWMYRLMIFDHLIDGMDLILSSLSPLDKWVWLVVFCGRPVDSNQPPLISATALTACVWLWAEDELVTLTWSFTAYKHHTETFDLTPLTPRLDYRAQIRKEEEPKAKYKNQNHFLTR